MFDIGFWELLLIAGIALLVLGPERLPRAASTLGRWIGQARRLARGLQSQVREELEREEQRLKNDLGVDQENDQVKAGSDSDKTA